MTDKTDSKERKADALIRKLRDVLDEARSYIGAPTFSPSMDSEAAVAVEEAGLYLAGRASLAASAGSEPVAGIYQLSPPASAHDTITEVIQELRTYNPHADEQGGKFIHKGWANQLEAVAPPQISESDSDYWVRNRALILWAIEERGFRLVSSGGLFWLSGPSHPSPPEGMVGWWLNPEDMEALQRVDECCDDGEGHDLPKARVDRLIELGVMRHNGGGYYSITSFGSFVLGCEHRQLPLETSSECNERLGREHKARLAAEAKGA